ncbi:hypothetical protein ES702_01957 [subsurface metagenome]
MNVEEFNSKLYEGVKDLARLIATISDEFSDSLELDHEQKLTVVLFATVGASRTLNHIIWGSSEKYMDRIMKKVEEVIGAEG